MFISGNTSSTNKKTIKPLEIRPLKHSVDIISVLVWHFYIYGWLGWLHRIVGVAFEENFRGSAAARGVYRPADGGAHCTGVPQSQLESLFTAEESLN